MKRYLTTVNQKRIPHYFTDVLVIGTGIAGLRATMEIDPALDVLVITKKNNSDSSSYLAQGGIACVQGKNDNFDSHIDDTLIAGGDLVDEDVVRSIVEEAPQRVQELLDWGVDFDKSASGDGKDLALGREGAHSHNRIVHAQGDATGAAIVQALLKKVQQQKNVQIWEGVFALDLITSEGQCVGATIWNAHHGRTIVWAKQVILATGGCGRLYRETTNPPVATCDGLAMAARANVTMRDLEFIQFHPTVLYIAGGSRTLISEATRGEGAYLVDKDGFRFMSEYDKRGELAPRDVVSRAVVAQMEKTKHPNVYLQMSHLPPEKTRLRFPGIAENCAKFGIDITKDPIPVRPGAHFMMGGIVADLSGVTSLPNLLAVGEVASTRLHGANRLASNSLLELLVCGRRAGELASKEALAKEDRISPHTMDDAQNVGLFLDKGEEEALNTQDIRNALKSQMWRGAGVVRTAALLDETRGKIQQWSNYVLKYQFSTPENWELQNLLLVAKLIVEASQKRTQSCGAHHREDELKEEESA